MDSAVLDGVRVVELTTMITGPLAGMMLADLGADVIKVENREGGDPFRNFGGDNYSAYFTSYNRTKRSITLDLRSPEGQRICLELIAKSDVLIDNFRPGVLDRLGMNHTAIATANPSIIHASITGFGCTGPYRDRPSYDTVAQSLSGMLAQFVDPLDPHLSGPTLSDNVGGLYAAYGILGALYERRVSGKGRRVEINMLEASIAFAPDAALNHKRYNIPIGPLTRVSVSQSYVFRCADDNLIAIHLSSRTKFWIALVTTTGRGELASDPRFAATKGRIANYEELRGELAPTFLEHTQAYWAEIFTANDVPFAPVLSPAEVFDDEQVRHLNSFYTQTHPEVGTLWGVRNPVWYDGARTPSATLPPSLGEHTDEILGELGLSKDAVAELRAREVI